MPKLVSYQRRNHDGHDEYLIARLNERLCRRGMCEKGFRTVSEYVRSFIRDVQERQTEHEKVDAHLLAVLDLGPAAPLGPADWQNIQKAVRGQHAKRRGI